MCQNEKNVVPVVTTDWLNGNNKKSGGAQEQKRQTFEVDLKHIVDLKYSEMIYFSNEFQFE